MPIKPVRSMQHGWITGYADVTAALCCGRIGGPKWAVHMGTGRRVFTLRHSAAGSDERGQLWCADFSNGRTACMDWWAAYSERRSMSECGDDLAWCASVAAVSDAAGGLLVVWVYRVTQMEEGTNDIIHSIHFGEKVPLMLTPVIFFATSPCGMAAEQRRPRHEGSAA